MAPQGVSVLAVCLGDTVAPPHSELARIESGGRSFLRARFPAASHSIILNVSRNPASHQLIAEDGVAFEFDVRLLNNGEPFEQAGYTISLLLLAVIAFVLGDFNGYDFALITKYQS